MNPFFTVVIPVFNKEKYVGRALESVLGQTYNDFEIIVVCDPSTDKSNEVVERYSQSKVKVLYREQPGPGGYAARNLGIKHASGQWIAFLDADDIWLENHLEVAFSCINKYTGHKVYTCARMLNEGNVRKLDEFSKSQNADNLSLSFYDYLQYSIEGKRAINSNSVVIKKDALNGYIWFPEGRADCSGDLYLWIYLLAHCERFIWSNNVASVSFRDVSDVSVNSLPNMQLNLDLFDEIKNLLNGDEIKLLKIYINRLNRMAWFLHAKKGIREKSLRTYFYWGVGDNVYCLKWIGISILPVNLINKMRKLKR